MSANNSTKNPHSRSSNDNNSSEKEYKGYAGIGPDIIRSYAEQAVFETHLTEDVCNTLSEDINYKLRYIIHDALLKARLCGRDSISSRDLEETFSNLSLEKVYGAPTNPNWVPFSDSNQTFLYLDDNLVNLIEMTEEETSYVQYGDVELTNKWYPEADTNNSAMKNYFTVACESVISNDEELRNLVLKDISENPQVGPIAQWFYHFGYFLLMKNITYDSLTLRALDLIEILENSPLNNASVSPKQLKLLVRLLLQRLLLTYTSPDILKRLCFTLSILCLRESLKEMTIAKINQKLDAVTSNAILPVVTTIYYLGIDAIREIFIPQITFFLDRVAAENNMDLVYFVLAIYGLICKAELGDTYIHNWFDILILNELIIYWQPLKHENIGTEKVEMHFVGVKSKLIKTRRKIAYPTGRNNKLKLEEVFTLPTINCKIRRKLDEFKAEMKVYKKQTLITVGKTSLLLSVLNTNCKNKLQKCCDHSMLSYNL